MRKPDFKEYFINWNILCMKRNIKHIKCIKICFFVNLDAKSRFLKQHIDIKNCESS